MGGGRGVNIEAMTALFTLTPEQVAKAKSLLKAYQAQVAPLQQYMRRSVRRRPRSTRTR
jgi:hypothetical protein